MNLQKKNNAFEFYRFFFDCIIFLLHIRKYGGFESSNGEFNGGYLAVEFFFILSGFLMMGKAERGREAAAGGTSPETLSVDLFISRYKRLMPRYWLSIIVLILADKAVLPGFSIRANLWCEIPEFFGLQTFWRPGGVNGQLWYVSALLWAGPLVYYLLLKYKDAMLNIVFPLGLLIFIGYIYQKVGHIDLTQNEPAFLGSFFRGFFEIGFGCVLYNVYSTYQRRVRESALGKRACSFAETLLFAIVVIIMWRTRRDHKDFLMIFLLGGLILVTAFGQGCLSKLLDNKFSALLGAVSYDIYINQLIFQRIVLSKFEGYPYWPVAFITLAVTIAYSFLTNALFKKIQRKKLVAETIVE